MSFSNQKSFEPASDLSAAHKISLRAALLAQLDALMQDHANEARKNHAQVPEHLFSTDTLAGAASTGMTRSA